MPNKKISAMPSLGGNQVPTDLVTAVDLSATPTQQNVKSTLNDLFSTLTKNITDRAIRFQAPGSAPAVSAASQGALYHNGTSFQASSNGGAYEQLYTLSAQSAALVFAGPTSGPAATPTFRALALTDLPQIATDSLLGRISAGTGTPEQITSTAALLTWLQNPISANLSTAVTDSTGAGGALVFAFNPVLTNPRFNTIAADPSGSGSNILFTPSVGAVNHIEILNATTGNGPTIRPTGLSANQPLNLASRGTGIISCVGNQLRVTGNTSGAAGILELRGGNASLSGGQIRLYEVTPGTNYIGFQAPDILASNLLFELPATDGTAGQVLSTDGAGILSWASFVADSITTNSFLGRTAAGTGPVQTLTAGAGVLSWLQTPTADNLRSAVTGNTGTGNLVFADGATISSPTITSGNLSFGVTGTGQKIMWDGSASLFNRLTFQSQTLNTNSTVTYIPNGTGLASGLTYVDRGDDTVNYNVGQFLVVKNTEMRINCASTASATPMPMNISTQNVARMTFENNSNIGINSRNYGNGVGVIAIRNAVTNPGIFPTDGGILYVSGGALRWRGPSTDTEIAPA